MTTLRPPAVLKIGGALLEEAESQAALWEGVHALAADGPVVVVHGGGPQATRAARALGHEPRIVHGRRVTTDIDLEILMGTVRGQIGTRLAARAVAAGLPALCLSGVDAGLLRVRRRPPRTIDGQTVDFGWVGDVVDVQLSPLQALLEAGLVPLIAPLGVDDDGHVYNVNADTVANTLAVALRARCFLLLTEAGGLRRDPLDPASMLSTCTPQLAAEGIAHGWIQGGMRVKADIALAAAAAGLHDVRIAGLAGLKDSTSGTRFLPPSP